MTKGRLALIGLVPALILLAGEGSRKRPWLALAPHRGAAGFQSPQRQRAIGSRIQVADMAGYIERSAL